MSTPLSLPRQPFGLVQQNMCEDKPSDYMCSLLFPANKKRIRVRASMTRPSEEQVDMYDNDVARAIRSNDLNQLRDLLEEDRCFTGCNRNGETLLHLACRRGKMDVVEFMILEAGVMTDVVDSMGRTAMHDVCWRPRVDFELMDFMIRTVSPELLISEDVRGHSCFDYCRKKDFCEVVEFLKKCSSLIQRRSKLAGITARSDDSC